ncbi:MAG: ABC transporter permease [Cytophagales bacterium]|nr:ABC transporter permease [Cytophagales bacterium]
MLEYWNEIWFTIKKHKLRTALTSFGVFWGIFMLVLLLGAGKGLENGVVGMFSDMAQNTTWIWAEKTTIAHRGLKAGRFIHFTNDDTKMMRQQFEDIKYLSAERQLWDNYITIYKSKNGSFQTSGISPDGQKITPKNIVEGRYVNEQDLAEHRKVVVIGDRVREILFGTEPCVGKFIKVNGIHFKVIGYFKLKNANGNWSKQELERIYMPLTTLQQTFNKPNRVGTYMFSPKDGADPQKLENDIKTFLRKRHFISDQDVTAIGSWNSGEEIKKFTTLFAGIRFFVWVVGIGTIIAGIVGVSNIMLIVVKERTKEIGIRKALGATPSSIVSMVIVESVIITSLSGYIGLVSGIALLEFVRDTMQKMNMENEFFKNPEVDINIAITAMIVLVVTGALAGLIPAQKAASIKPVEALKDE